MSQVTKTNPSEKEKMLYYGDDSFVHQTTK